jgi:outer membrane receptor for ferrienterochelin and colicin
MADTIANPYRINLNTWRIDGYIKNGYVFDDESGSSVALITAVSYHDQDNYYGVRNWKANQLNAYLNAICQLNFEGSGEIDNDHRLSTGLSLNYDRYGENLQLSTINYQLSTLNYQLDRQELVPGLFAEYSLKYADMLSLVAGVRADYSTRYGFFATPRMNIRYTPFAWWTLRGSIGLGYRSPNAIADNANILPSSRTLHLMDNVKQERAMNTGISTTFYIPMGSKELQLSAEYYYTHFMNSLIVDMDQDPHAVYIYNQSDIAGAKSFAHCAQIEASIEVLRGWTWTAAFRYTDVEQTTFNAAKNRYELRPKALTNRFKGIITTSYQTPLKKWQFDVTAQFNGVSRVPDGFEQPFTWYPQLMAQITKFWRTCSVYVGAENMTNFRQEHPIVDSFHPYGTDFDASMVCGPTTGWKVYVGFRYDLEKPED